MTLALEIESDRKQACKLPDKLTPSKWAAQKRILSSKAGSAEPGPWNPDRTPYAVEPMDAICEPIEQLVLMWCTQVGKSTLIENIIGYWVEEDPGPTLMVMPTESSVKETLEERIKPLIESTLADHARPDRVLQTGIEFDTMRVHFGWSGSPNSLARRPCRNVVFDEVDKFVPFAGREADPISLGEQRVTTYLHRARIVKVGTPTTREGNICRAWDLCGDKRRYYVPCSHCGVFQLLAFQQIRWPKFEGLDKPQLADKIIREDLAHYECSSCHQAIKYWHKPKMLRAGKWLSENQTIDVDGTIHGERPQAKRVGYHLSALYSPWLNWSKIAAQFILADGDPGATMNFRNSWLAEPFEVQVSKREPSVIREKSEHARTLGRAGEKFVVPSWSVIVLATCDVQKDHCIWDVSTWGYELKSKRIAIGISATLDEVYRNVFSPDVPFVSEQGGVVHVANLIVDSGFRKDEVTEFARRDPIRVHIAKGLSTYFGPIAEQKIEKASGVVVWNINTMQSKDTLDRLIGDDDTDRWQVYPGIGDEFCLQMASEHKVLNPQTRQLEWKTKTSGAANHRWDCEAMATAVATAMGAAMPKPPDPKEETIKLKPEPRDRPDWIPERPNNWTRR